MYSRVTFPPPIERLIFIQYLPVFSVQVIRVSNFRFLFQMEVTWKILKEFTAPNEWDLHDKYEVQTK